MIEQTRSGDGISEQILDELLDQVSKKLQAGDPVDLEAYAAKHPEYEQRIRQLLPAMEVLAGLKESALADKTQPNAPDSLEADRQLGDYRILREVGRGGMGVVYEAEQISLRRPVALKVLPFAAVLDQRQIRRFQNEALAAAQLKHPNIVSVFGVGCERSVHFYAMEFVEGQTLAEVIDDLRSMEAHEGDGRRANESSQIAESLACGGFSTPSQPAPVQLDPTTEHGEDPRESATQPADAESRRDTSAIAAFSTGQSTKSRAYFRCIAELAIQVTDALNHAHEEGVIHRDIKPSNLILNSRGKISVTDFGLARIENDPSMTMTGDILGTLRYMSPEQAMAKRVIVDHRTDIYSWGVTLYELLTLQPVFSGSDRQELLRQIAFEEPRAPRKLNRSIPAELETIVLTAISKNPTERYTTAGEMADDLRNFLQDKPILARRPTIAQRIAKWSRRHKSVVWSCAAVLMLALISLVVSVILISREQAETQKALGQARNNEAKAKLEADRAKTVIDVLDEMLGLAGENVRTLEDDSYTVRQMLDDFCAQVDDQMDVEPEVEATIRGRIGRAYNRLGLYESADPHYRRVIELHRQIYGDKHDSLAKALMSYSWLLVTAQKTEAAEEYAREALAICRQGAEPAPMLYDALGLMTNLHARNGELAACVSLAREGLEVARVVYGEVHSKTATATVSLADALSYVGGKSDEVKRLMDDALRMHRRLDEKDYRAGWRLISFAEARRADGKLTQAEQLSLEAVEIFRHIDGEKSTGAAAALSELSIVYAAQGESSNAAAAYADLLAIRREQNDALDPSTAATTRRLIWALRSGGDLDRIVAVRQESVDWHRKRLGYEHPRTVVAMQSLSRALREKGDDEAADEIQREAVEVLRQQVEDRRRRLGDNHLDTAESLSGLTQVVFMQQDLAAAAQYLREALEIYRQHYGESDHRVATNARWLHRALRALDQHAENQTLLRERIARLRDQLGNDAPEVARQLLLLAAAQNHSEQFDDAEASVHAALAIYRKQDGDTHDDVVGALENISRIMETRGDRAAAEDLYRKIIELDTKRLAENDGDADAFYDRGWHYAELDQWDSAIADMRKAAELEQWPTYYSDLALAQLGQGDTEGYRQTCAAMIERFDNPTPSNANQLAWCCCLLADTNVDLTQVIRLAERAVQYRPWSRRRSGDFEKTLGAALYRAGQWEQAVERLAQADMLAQKPSFNPSPPVAEVWWFLAMAHYRLGNRDEANHWLDKAVQWSEAKRSGRYGEFLSWEDRIPLQLLRAESESLLGRTNGTVEERQ